MQSDPQVWLLVRTTGMYEDRREVPLSAFLSQADADAACALAEKEWCAAESRYPFPSMLWADELTDAEYDKWERSATRRNARFRKMLTVDPSGGPNGSWEPNPPEYSVWVVPLAGERRDDR